MGGLWACFGIAIIIIHILTTGGFVSREPYSIFDGGPSAKGWVIFAFAWFMCICWCMCSIYVFKQCAGTIERDERQPVNDYVLQDLLYSYLSLHRRSSEESD